MDSKNDRLCTVTDRRGQSVDIVTLSISQGRRRWSGRTASAGPLFGSSMLSAMPFFLVSVPFTFYSDFIQYAKIY